MKMFINTLLTILCLVILIVGQIHFSEKTSITTVNKEGISDSSSKILKANESSDKDAVSEDTVNYYLFFTKNWPAESVNTFKEKLLQGKPFKIAIVGSRSLGNGIGSWPEIVKEALISTYKDYIDVSILRYDLTSTEFINKHTQDKISDQQADLILFEPFTLKDNGIVTIDDSLANLTSIMSDVQKANPDTTFILQPPHPLYNATFYPYQVEKLQSYAEEKGITYLNHWETWPNQKSEEIKNYLSADSSEPSSKGHQLWANYLIDYFIYK